MSDHRETNLWFTDQRLFKFEHEAALTIGVVCLGVAAWTGFCAHPFAVAQPCFTYSGISVDSVQLLAIALGFIGISLLRLLLHGRQEKALRQAVLQANRSNSSKGKPSSGVPKYVFSSKGSH